MSSSDTPYGDRYAADDARAQAMLDALLSIDPSKIPEDPEEAPSRQRKLDEAKAEIFDICDVTIGVRKKFTDAGMSDDQANNMATIFWHHLIDALFGPK